MKEKLRQIANFIKKIDFKINQLIQEPLIGRWLSTFKGSGLEFVELRQYVPGDDIRNIDWKTFAKKQELYVKEYQEERQLSVLFWIDSKDSMKFGTFEKEGKIITKFDLAAEIALILSAIAIRGKDRVGGLTNSYWFKPQQNKSKVLGFLTNILANGSPEFNYSLKSLLNMYKRKALLILISDFFSMPDEKLVKYASLRYQILPVIIWDKSEIYLEPYKFYNFEGWRGFLTKSGAEEYKRKRLEKKEAIINFWKRLRIKPLFLDTSCEPIDEVKKYLSV